MSALTTGLLTPLGGFLLSFPLLVFPEIQTLTSEKTNSQIFSHYPEVL